MRANKILHLVLAVALISLLAYSTPTVEAVSPTILNVPIDRQDLPLSCEAASLKMALNYKGLPVTETQLIAIIGHDASARAGDRWGDPNKYYVGSLYGRQNSTGYGVHWDPIARAAQIFKPQSHAFIGWNSTQLAQSITDGNPVIIWGVGGKARRDGWFTPEGNYVNTWVGEHTRLVIGFTGSVDNPQKFILNDPWSGRITWSRTTLERNWSTFNYAGVVIY